MGKTLGGFAEGRHPRRARRRGEECSGRSAQPLGELKTDEMVAEILGFQGEAFFYAGDFKSAHSLYAQALEAATRSKEPDTIRVAKANLVKVQVQEKRPQVAISSFRR